MKSILKKATYQKLYGEHVVFAASKIRFGDLLTYMIETMKSLIKNHNSWENYGKHASFSFLSGCLANILCTFNFHPVFTGGTAGGEGGGE